MKSRFPDVPRWRASIVNVLLLLGATAAMPALAQVSDHAAWPDGSTDVVRQMAAAETQAALDLSVVASLVGDRDDFGFNGGAKSCSSFDNRTAGDHPAFDVSAPGGTASGCQFEGTWTHTFAVPPDGVAHFAIRIPEIMADDSRWGCNFQENAERMTLDGAPVYGFLPEGVSCTTTTLYKQSFWGAEANAIAGDGSIVVWYTQGGDQFALDYSEIVDVWAPVEIRAVGGDGQRGVIGGPVEYPLEVEIITSNPSILAAKVPITFELIGPRGSSGGGISWGNSNPDTVGPTANTVYADANGRASVRVVLGDKEGEYIVRARSGMSLTDTPVDFVLTARKPASVRIIKDEPDTAYLEDSYAISSVVPTSFYAVGLDESGNKIGRVRSTWTVKAGRPAGDATLMYDTTFPTSTNTVTPTTAGRVDVAAKPVVKGVRTASTSLYIVGVVLSLSGDVAQNHIWSFVPGSTLNGSSVLLPEDPTKPIQRVSLFIQTGTSAKGSITTALEGVSSYPGVAMNYPPGIQDLVSADLSLSDPNDLDAESNTIPWRPFSDDGVSSYVLNVRDYGASGVLRVTIKNGRDEFALAQPLPIDNDANRIPDIGWYALSDSTTGVLRHINQALLGSSDDDEPSDGAAGEPALGLRGDGLTAVEEYRGFIVQGLHRRLDARTNSDLFVRIDANLLDRDQLLLALSPRVTPHYVRSNEVIGELGPEINPNRGSMPGASLQRAVRIRAQLSPPNVLYMGTVYSVVDLGVLGYTFAIGQNLSLLDKNTEPSEGSPNETAVSEYYPITNDGGVISSGTDKILQTTVSSGDVLVNGAEGPTIFAGTDGLLQSVPCDQQAGCDDYKTQGLAESCTSPFTVLLTPEQFATFQAETVAHEAGHAIHIEHDYTDCTASIMIGGGDNELPLNTDFLSTDQAQIRLHVKH